MAEYIEREVLMAELAKGAITSSDLYGMGIMAGMDASMKKIAEAPAADVVEVVRCGECKHFFYYGKTSLFVDGENIRAGWCQRRARYDEEHRMTRDDFCSYGEKRDNNATEGY